MMGIESQFDIGFELVKASISVNNGQEGKLYVLLVLTEGHAGILGILKNHILIFTGENLVRAKEFDAQLEAPIPSLEAHIKSLIWVVLLPSPD